MKLILKILIALFIVASIGYYSIDFLLNFWWFSSLKLGTFYILRESYAGLVIGGTTIAVAGLVYFNLAYVARALALSTINDLKGILAILSRHPIMLFLFSLLVVIPLLEPVYSHWESFLLFYFGASSELTDPVYAKDISYYLFSYPIYELIQAELLWILALVLALVSCLYTIFYKKYHDSQLNFPVAAKLHLATLVSLLVLVEAWSIALQRIAILYEDRHLPVFYGPGFVEMNYRLPLIWLSFLLFLATAIAAIYFIYKGNKGKLVLGLGVAYLLVLGIKQIDFIPNMIDDYYVAPNPVDTEASYMRNHIQATTDAFNFADIKEIDYALVSSLTESIGTEIKRELHNIPLWDNDLLAPVFEQLQSIRPYFSFNEVAVDRYYFAGNNHQVNVAARELDYQSLPAEAQNWRNQHLVYTHGYGLVMSPSHQSGNQPMQWYMHNFGQVEHDAKLTLQQPEVFYGLANYPYAIVPNAELAPLADKASGDMSTDYQGTGGLPISSLLSKAVVAIFFKDERIFFSAAINQQSRILVRRNILQRIKVIAPFLVLSKEPYPVVVNNKIYWIVDAFTYSDRYPLVEPISLPNAGKHAVKFNYVRNSVKIIVDAYNGSVDFYVVDTKDPIIKTYQNLYPSLFKDITAVPKSFIKHFSYPEGWFALQMRLYARYHQKEPEIFYQQNETLEFSLMDGKPVQPYYLTLDIEEHLQALPAERQKFILVSPLSPIGRENLDSIAIAGCLKPVHCEEHYQDDIYVYKFSKEIQVDGPGQISALMNQNTDISAQFTLWDQHGSKVIRGRMIIVPIEHSLLYIQPLYLEAESEQGFPSLVKVLVAMNHETVIGDSLPEAFEKLQQKLRKSVQ